jgi:hypothetical protein
MDFEKLYGVDVDAVENGKWMVTQEGFDVKIAKLGNPAFNAEVVRLQKPHLSLLRSSANTDELIDKIAVRAMAKTILLDWKAESNGVAIEYTPELGYDYMMKSPDFKEDVSTLSAARDNFKPEHIAEK